MVTMHSRGRLENFDDQDSTIARILVLSKDIWENHISKPDIDQWLENFDGSALAVEAEHLNALHLLSHFNYFGAREIRELLRAVFRDLFRYPLIQSIRTTHGGLRDAVIIDSLFRMELDATRFLGMGNPSESGAHLLYYFRQENKLSKGLFIHQHEILDAPTGSPDARIAIRGLKRLVFIDDLLGSGSQATEYSKLLLESVRAAAERDGIELEILYFTLFAKSEGLGVARSLNTFDRVSAIHEMSPSESAFDLASRVYTKTPPGVSREQGQVLASKYGNRLFPGHGLGYGDGQLLLGLHHNVPDNTLPIFWCDETAIDWTPIFPRYHKVY